VGIFVQRDESGKSPTHLSRLQDRTSTFPINQKYILLKELGKGSYGKVWLACRVPKPSDKSIELFAMKFLNEANFDAALKLATENAKMDGYEDFNRDVDEEQRRKYIKKARASLAKKAARLEAEEAWKMDHFIGGRKKTDICILFVFFSYCVLVFSS